MSKETRVEKVWVDEIGNLIIDFNNDYHCLLNLKDVEAKRLPSLFERFSLDLKAELDIGNI